MSSTIASVAHALASAGVDLESWGLAWVRLMPTVVLVPAFGLRALPRPAQTLTAAMLAACIAPALRTDVVAAGDTSLGLLAVRETLRGLPVAIAAAVPLWAATMAGGVADASRTPQETLSMPTVEGRPTLFGAAFSLLAGALFLETGGPARVAQALAVQSVTANPVHAVATHLKDGIELAVAVGGPLLAAQVVIEVAGALVARAAAPAQVHALFAPIRSLGLLAVLGVLFERAASVLALAVRSSP